MAKTFTLRDAGNSAFVPGFRLVDAELPNGITLRTAIGGPRYSRKRPLVMLHGHPHTHVIWRKVAPFFAKDRLVILPDLRGYGDSSPPVLKARNGVRYRGTRPWLIAPSI